MKDYKNHLFKGITPLGKNNSAKRFSFEYLKQILFIVLSIVSLLPFVDTPTALAAGIVFGLTLNNPFPQLAGKLSKILLQMSVVGLGFGIGIFQVIEEGKHSIIYTIIGITITIVVGNYIGRLLKINSRTSKLISFGTAICGGSAIAAMAPVLKAKDEEIAVSLAIVFTLNSIGYIDDPPGSAGRIGRGAFRASRCPGCARGQSCAHSRRRVAAQGAALGDPTARWVAEDMPQAVARAFGRRFVQGAPGGAVLNVHVDDVLLPPLTLQLAAPGSSMRSAVSSR